MPQISLDIYLTDDCFACDGVEALAADVGGWFPQIRVVLHHLNAGADLPSGVVAVPAFVLDGRVIQYGTPDQARISEEIVGALRSRPDAFAVEEGES